MWAVAATCLEEDTKLLNANFPRGRCCVVLHALFGCKTRSFLHGARLQVKGL